MFRSFPLCLCGAGHRQLGTTLNSNPKEEPLRNGFSLCRQSFTLPKIFLVRRPFVLFLGFLYWSGIILFSSDLFLFTFFWSLIANSSFSFLFFLFISSFSFFSFLSLPFFSDLWCGIRVLAFVIRGLVLDRGSLCRRWHKSLRVNGLVGRDWQRVQKTTLVSTCYRALSLTDSKRMFIRITNWVFPPAP